MDTRAIWMVVQQPSKAVSIKNEKQQAVLSLHKMRRQLVKFSMTKINGLHRLLLDFGETLDKWGLASLNKSSSEVLNCFKETLAPFLIYQIKEQYRGLGDLDTQIVAIEEQLAAASWVKQNNGYQQIMQIHTAIKTLIFTAKVTIIGNANPFRSWLEFSAYIWLVQKQTSTSRKVRLTGYQQTC
ncbi:MAG: hypothetical protein ACTS73_00385 [Arsenophonus sp. NEOnobi-MAG3]